MIFKNFFGLFFITVGLTEADDIFNVNELFKLRKKPHIIVILADDLVSLRVLFYLDFLSKICGLYCGNFKYRCYQICN